MPGRPTTADADRALAFNLATSEACADAVLDAPFGRVLSTPSLPLVFSLNEADVLRPGADAAAIRAALPDVPRASALVVPESDHDRLTQELAGWEVEHELTMVLADPPAPPPPGRVREADPVAIDALQRQWLTDDFAEQGPEAVDQLMAYMGRQRAARPTRAFVSPDGDAMTLLWSDGETAQLEDVYTRPDARGRGHARALVSHCAALAASEGHATVFIVADALDSPKELYAKLGFAGVARALRCTQPAS